VDAVQRRNGLTAVPVATWRKYQDDQAGLLGVQISHAGFLSVFPALLVLVTGLGLVLRGHEGLQHDIVNSALSQFPVIGTDLKRNVHQLSSTNVAVLLFGLAWTAYGCTRLSRAAQGLLAGVWGVDQQDLPTLAAWVPRALGFLVVLAVGFVAGGTLAGLGAFGRLGPVSAPVGFVAVLAVNVGMYLAGLHLVIRLPGRPPLVVAALVACTGWSVLQFLGAQLVNHQLRHLSDLYGTFATVLGLVWWIGLGATITVWAVELDCVVTRRLWPRPLTPLRPVPDPPDRAAEPDGPRDSVPARG
jgi:uncharacterized BrkB/YihY/UPF0761 family membrane protein